MRKVFVFLGNVTFTTEINVKYKIKEVIKNE